MPKLLKAERSSNASSASRLGGSTLDPWEQASSLVSGGLRGLLCKTCGEGTASSEKDPEEDCHNVAHGSQSRIEGKGSSKSSCRGDEEDSQLIHASGRVPKKARTRLAMMSFSGPTARQDAERAEKSRWLSPRGHADTSWTKTGGETCCVQQHGTGSQIRNAQKPGACTATLFLLAGHVSSSSIPVGGRACAGLLGAQGAGTVHSSSLGSGAPELGLPQKKIAEISPAARLTVRPRYSNLLAELLSQTKPGAEPRQAPRPVVKVLEAIERTVVDYREPVFICLYAWFHLLQTWCSLRFDDHRGLEPGLLRISETSLMGVLTRSKTHGPDKRIQRKPVFLEKSCWFEVKNWCDVGFDLLQELAPYERDYMLPSPGPNYGGIGEAEMSYDAGLATTSSLHRGLVAEGQRLLDPALCVYWTPHSPRSFMATCCAALEVAKAERNVLGRWAQNQSDTYVWLQRTLVQKLQLLVVSVLRGRDDIGSVLGEGESLQELESFVEKRGVSRDAVKTQLMKLDKAALPGHALPQGTEAQPLQVQVEALEEEMVQLDPVPEDELDVVVRRQPGRQACANIKESRAQALKELPDRFHVSEAGRSKAKRRHWLEYCWMVPGVDYFVYSYKGPLMPPDHEYEEVCKCCSTALFTPVPQDSGSDRH